VVAAASIRVVHGLQVAAPAEVLLACARDLGLLDLVVLIDGALQSSSCTEREIADVAGGRRAGAPLLRRALTYADRRSESPWESMLRMLHVACDVPVEPQHRVFDQHGRFLARGDLWIRGTRVLHEYDGGEHLKRPRQRTDLRRGRELANVGWIRRGYTSQEVLHQAVGILRDADMSLGRPHRPERVRAWHALLAESLFTPRGTARLLRRLGPQDAHKSGHEMSSGEA
jgi:very-short-patch-repair endonuclease